MTMFSVLLVVLIAQVLLGNGGPLIPTNIPPPILACIYLVIFIVLLVLGNVRFS